MQERSERRDGVGDFVRLELHGAVGMIRLDRPPVNAINIQIHHELLDVAQQVAESTIRAVVLYGGERSFAAGGDIKELATCGPGEITAGGRTLNHAISVIARLGQPVVAAVNGYALGLGCELALAADFRIVADDVRIGLPEVTLGVIPGGGGTQRLPRLVGVTKAKELIFSGRPVDGPEAVRIGLATRSLPSEAVLPAAMELAGRLAAGPTAALAAAKRAIDDGMDGTVSAGLELEARRFAELFATDDQTIGMTSFLRDGPGKATFTGR
jgi:enoyl-CoA hydratase/carnithine racemase